MNKQNFDFKNLDVELLNAVYQANTNGGGVCDWVNNGVSALKRTVGEPLVNAAGDAGNYLLDRTPAGNTNIGTAAKIVRSVYRTCH